MIADMLWVGWGSMAIKYLMIDNWQNRFQFSLVHFNLFFLVACCVFVFRRLKLICHYFLNKTSRLSYCIGWTILNNWLKNMSSVNENMYLLIQNVYFLLWFLISNKILQIKSHSSTSTSTPLLQTVAPFSILSMKCIR